MYYSWSCSLHSFIFNDFMPFLFSVVDPSTKVFAHTVVITGHGSYHTLAFSACHAATCPSSQCKPAWLQLAKLRAAGLCVDHLPSSSTSCACSGTMSSPGAEWVQETGPGLTCEIAPKQSCVLQGAFCLFSAFENHFKSHPFRWLWFFGLLSKNDRM